MKKEPQVRRGEPRSFSLMLTKEKQSIIKFHLRKGSFVLNKCMSKPNFAELLFKNLLHMGGGRRTPYPSKCSPSDDANLNSHGPGPMQNVATQMVLCIFECILLDPNKVKDERSQMLMGWSSNVKELKELRARVPME